MRFHQRILLEQPIYNPGLYYIFYDMTIEMLQDLFINLQLNGISPGPVIDL